MRRIASFLILLTIPAASSWGLVSTNVPLGHWSYEAVDKLANYGLIDSSMLSIRPLSRVEMARHVGQAMLALDARKEDMPPMVGSVVDRLKQEYRVELTQMALLDGWYSDAFLKPVEDPYVRYLHANEMPDLENRRGDGFEEGSNYRAGFASRMKLGERFAFYLHPEFADSSREDSDVELIEGYGKVMLGPFEAQAGKDSLWWGPGYHGSMIMSNNAEPFTMIKVTNPQPMPLPWIFRVLGPVRGQWFLAWLEEDRDIPEARLSGVRLSIKPHPLWDLGFSRVVMFGGRGMPRVDLFDYGKMFVARSEQAENNQIAGFDTSVLLPLSEFPLGERLPFRSLRFYLDGAGEDEAGGIPSNWGFLYGLQINDLLKTGRTDVRVEYANNHVGSKPDVFYNHSIYTSGYTYEDRIIGHHMGTDSSDLFVQLSHYLRADLILNLAFDRQTSSLETDEEASMNVYEMGLTFFASPDWRLEAAYRFEDRSDLDDNDHHIVELGLTRRF